MRCVVALIPGSGNTILMGKRRDTKKWACPAGHLEPQEVPEAGLIREVKEETGLDIVHYKLISENINENGTTIYTYICKVRGTIDTSRDPDKEFPSLSFVDPKEKDLHIPLHKSYPIQWWICKN